MTDAVCEELFDVCPYLTDVCLQGCTQLTDIGVTWVRSFPNLIALDISGCSNVTDNTLAVVGSMCTVLQHINLNGCTRITDAGIKLLQPLKYLQALNLSCCDITDAAMWLLGGKRGAELLPRQDLLGREGALPAQCAV